MGLVRRRPVPVPALQAQLRPRESLVEYVLDEKVSYAIEINRGGLKIHSLPARGQISNASRSFVTAIRDEGDFRPSAQELYKQVIAPIINGEVSSLIVVDDGPLHLIPFSASTNENGPK